MKIFIKDRDPLNLASGERRAARAIRRAMNGAEGAGQSGDRRDILAAIRLHRASIRLAAKPGNEAAVAALEGRMAALAKRYLGTADAPP